MGTVSVAGSTQESGRERDSSADNSKRIKIKSVQKKKMPKGLALFLT